MQQAVVCPAVDEIINRTPFDLIIREFNGPLTFSVKKFAWLTGCDRCNPLDLVVWGRAEVVLRKNILVRFFRWYV